MNLCKDCKFKVAKFYCANPKNGLDFIEGTPIVRSIYISRGGSVFELGCGKNGVWFEPRPESWYNKFWGKK